MQTFLGYGTCSSSYDGRRHIACLFTYYAYYQMLANPSCVPAIKSAMQMTGYTSSSRCLTQYLYKSDFLAFINQLKIRFALSTDDITRISSADLMKVGITKTPAGYDRSKNIELVTHHAYLMKFFTPLNGPVLSQVIRYHIPLFTGMRGGITESDINRINSIVNSELRSGNTDLRSIETKVHTLVP